jgi:hypothetical protein
LSDLLRPPFLATLPFDAGELSAFFLRGEFEKMEITETQIDRWLERGGKFFKTVSRNPVVRGALLARGLTDEELAAGWRLYTDLHGFGAQIEARAATRETAAAQAINEIDAWDAPAFSAARAVLDARYPEVTAFLFENLEATVGVAAITGVERFLDRVDALRDGKASPVNADAGRAAAALLATRRIVDDKRAAELRSLIAKARLGARPEEVIPAPEMDPRRREVAQSFITWLNEWREVARVAVARRDYRISLGIAQRRRSSEDEGDVEAPIPAQASGRTA